MATFYATMSEDSRYQVELTVTEISTNVEANTSNVSYDFSVRRTGGGGKYSFTASNNAIYVGINGVELANRNVTYDFRSTTLISFASGILENIAHNADGTMSISVVGAFSTNLMGRGEASGVLPLTTIPRATSPFLITPTVEIEQSYNISPASTNFRHNIYYEFGTKSGTIATDVYNSFSWTPPLELAEVLTHTDNGYGNWILDTYSNGAFIGRKVASIWLFIPATEKFVPTLSTVSKDVNTKTLELTGDENKVILGYSNVEMNITKTIKTDVWASFSSMKVNDVEVGNVNKVTLNAVPTNVFKTRLEDSRKFFAEDTNELTVVPYSKLTGKGVFERLSPVSNTIKLKYNGKFFQGSFGAVSNVLTLGWSYQLEDGTWSAITPINHVFPINEQGIDYSGEIELEGTFDYQKSYNFRFHYSDKLVTGIWSQNVTKGVPVIDWGENDFKFNVDVYDKNNKKFGETNKRILVSLNSNYTQSGVWDRVLFDEVIENNTNIVTFDFTNKIFTFNKKCKVIVKSNIFIYGDTGTEYIWSRIVKNDSSDLTHWIGGVNQFYKTSFLETPQITMEKGDFISAVTNMPVGGTIAGQYTNGTWLEIEILEELE